MVNPQECPECESWSTEVVHTEWFEHFVERTRICNECLCQYTISYAHPVVEEVIPDAA